MNTIITIFNIFLLYFFGLFFVLFFGLFREMKTKVNLILVELTKHLNLTEYPPLWLSSCKIIQENLVRCSLTTREIILKELLVKIQGAPIIISPATIVNGSATNNVATSLQLFDCIQKAVDILFSFINNEPTLLPMYKIITIVQEFFNDDQHKNQEPHWILSRFTDIIFIHKHNLANLLTVMGSIERCRVVTRYRDDVSPQSNLPKAHQIIDESTACIEMGQQSNEMWQRGVHTLLKMICDQVPIGTILLHLLGTHFNVYPTRMNLNQSSDHRKLPAPSQLLLEACLLRVKQLVEFTELRSKTKKFDANSTLEDISKDLWGEWQRFGFQFYSFVEEQMVDFEDFVCKASQLKLRDNGLVWLLIQCICIERLKDYFMKDIRENNGWLSSTILSFNNPSQLAPDQKILIRDTSVEFLIYRMRSIVTNKCSPYHINALVPPSILTKLEELEKHSRWWLEVEKNPQTFSSEFEKTEGRISLCLLSNFSSQAIADKISGYLSQCTENTFNGRSEPLPTILLSCLALKSRQRIFDAVEKSIMMDDQTVTKPVSPGIVETYARLSCMAPTVKRYKLQSKIRKEVTPESPLKLLFRLQTLIEITNYRLIPLFRFNNAMRWLILDLYQNLSRTHHHQLFHSIENLFIKAALHQTSICAFKADAPTIDFGRTANRVLLFSLARIIKLHGVADYSTLNDSLPPLLTRLIDLTGVATWSKQRAYFPRVITNIFENYEKNLGNNNSAVNFNYKWLPDHVKVTQLTESFNQYSKDENGLTHVLRSRIREVLPAVFCLKQRNPNYSTNSNPNVNNSINVVKKVLASIPPIQYVSHVYDFVNYIIDVGHSKSFEGIVHTIGSTLDSMIWTDGLFKIDRILLALADYYDENPQNEQLAYSLIYYFLFQSDEIRKRVQHFLTLKTNAKTWKEPDFYSKSKAYFIMPCASLPEQLLPIYYGTDPLRLLPIFDILICRFIESQHFELLKEFLNTQHYVSLYVYHEAPVTMVTDILRYYYKAEIPSSALVECGLLNLISDRFVVAKLKEFYEVLQNSDPAEVIQNLIVLELAKATNTTPSPTTAEPSNISNHTFKEFATKSDKVLTICLLEILSLTLERGTIVEYLFQPLMNAVTCNNFAHLNAIGLIFACLPVEFTLELLSFFAATFCEENVMLFEYGTLDVDGPISNPFSSRCFSEFSNNVDPLLSTSTNCIITMLHSFLYYSSIEVFDSPFLGFIEIINENRKTTCSYQHLYILCRIVAPWIYWISSKTQLIDTVITFFLFPSFILPLILANLIFFLLRSSIISQSQ